MREIKSYKGGDKMKTLTRNKVKQEDNILTKEQLEQLIPILDQIKYEREVLGVRYYTEEEVHERLIKIVEEAENKVE